MCGIIGIYNNFSNLKINTSIQKGLQKLQHRGQDGYGYYFNYQKQKLEKTINKIGLIQEHKFPNSYKIALGHTRYSTSYQNNKNDINCIQPFLGNNSNWGKFVLVHNGNLTNLDLVIADYGLSIDSKNLNDSQLLVSIIENSSYNLEETLRDLIQNINGIFNLIVYQNENDTIYALKDKFGNRPLCIGENNRGICIASETVALEDYTYLREIRNGELVRVDNSGLHSINININTYSQKCLFEYIYLQKKESVIREISYDSNVKKITIEDIRRNFGEELARKESYTIGSINRDKIVVIGAPNTGIPIGESFAHKLDIPYQQFITKRKGSHRSFIMPDTDSRLKECYRKFIVDTNITIKNKIVFFVDDSLVRGNTIKTIIQLLNSFEPQELHIRIASPEVKYPCYYGIDIPTENELVMNHYSIAEYVKELDIKSLVFLTTEEMSFVLRKNMKLEKKDMCMACFDNQHHPLLDF